jgi:hypothetical protein
MPPMIRSAPLRTLAAVLVAVLALTLVTPARAEADVLTGLAIGALAVAGAILVAYLIIANVADAGRAADARPVRVACAGAGCAGLGIDGRALAPARDVEAP